MKNKTELTKMKKEELVNLALEYQESIETLNFKLLGYITQNQEMIEYIDELTAKLNVSGSAVTTEEVLDNTLEDVAQQLSQMVNEEENNNYEVDGVDNMNGVFEMNEEVVCKVEEVIETIAKHKASLISTVLNADYVSTPDVLVACGKEAIINTLSKLKGNRVGKELKALTAVSTFIQEKKELIASKGYNEEGELNLLGKLGQFIKSIIVKVLKTLLATGKVIGKTAIVIGTLISKVAVFTIVETLDAGKSILTIAKNEYKQAILG